ncbi:MAG TPA: UbiA family prenyltransferase [Gemmatimonadales bacterium]|nr:UbiA family prenyltransferase [Gemmatimonadales bacterium]
MPEVLRLVRAHNLVIAAAGVVAGGWIALERAALPGALACAALSGIGLGMAGNVLNDILDVDADAVNLRRDRPLAGRRIGVGTAVGCVVAGAVGGLVTAAAAGRAVLLAGAGALAVMIVYSPLLKPVPLVGNLAVSTVAGLPLMYGALAVQRPGAGLIPWVLAGALHLVREIAKDIEDLEGDRVVRRRTLPVVLGREGAAAAASLAAVAFVPLSLVLPRLAGYDGAYFAIALPAQMAVLVTASRLLLGETERVSALLKGAMLTGIVALVAGRLA